MGMIRQARDELRRNMNPRYRKEELANWPRIKRQHPKAFIRSKTTNKGVTRLAIFGSGKQRKVVPVSFLRYKNPEAVGGLLVSTRDNTQYPFNAAADAAYYKNPNPKTINPTAEYYNRQAAYENGRLMGNYITSRQYQNAIRRLRRQAEHDPDVKDDITLADDLKFAVKQGHFKFNPTTNPKAIYPLLTALFGLALLKVASIATRQDEMVVDESEVMCSCQAHVTMHRKGDHG